MTEENRARDCAAKIARQIQGSFSDETDYSQAARIIAAEVSRATAGLQVKLEDIQKQRNVEWESRKQAQAARQLAEAECERLRKYRQIAEPAIGIARCQLSRLAGNEAKRTLDKLCDDLDALDAALSEPAPAKRPKDNHALWPGPEEPAPKEKP